MENLPKLDPNVLDDIEVLELMSDVLVKGKRLLAPDLFRKVLGEDGYAQLKAHFAKDGKTSLNDMIEWLGSDAFAKN